MVLVLGRLSSGCHELKSVCEGKFNSLSKILDEAACGISSETLLAVSSRDSLRCSDASGSTPMCTNEGRDANEGCGVCCDRASLAKDGEEDAWTV